MTFEGRTFRLNYLRPENISRLVMCGSIFEDHDLQLRGKIAEPCRWSFTEMPRHGEIIYRFDAVFGSAGEAEDEGRYSCQSDFSRGRTTLHHACSSGTKPKTCLTFLADHRHKKSCTKYARTQ